MRPVLISLDDAAKSLSISRRKLDQLIASGRLAKRYLDGRVGIRYAELEAFVDSLPTDRQEAS